MRGLLAFFLIYLFFNALILGMVAIIMAPIFVMFHCGFWWGLLAAYLIWPLVFTINLVR